jgi:hypothetical protein
MTKLQIFIFPLRYYANCVSTTLTVLILHNAESVYFFYSNPVYLHSQIAGYVTQWYRLSVTLKGKICTGCDVY